MQWVSRTTALWKYLNLWWDPNVPETGINCGLWVWRSGSNTRPLVAVQKGVAPAPKRSQRTFGRVSLPGPERPFAASPNYFWELSMFGPSPRHFGLQHRWRYSAAILKAQPRGIEGKRPCDSGGCVPKCIVSSCDFNLELCLIFFCWSVPDPN